MREEREKENRYDRQAKEQQRKTNKMNKELKPKIIENQK